MVAKMLTALEIDSDTVNQLDTVQAAKKSAMTRKAFCKQLVSESANAADAQTYLVVFGDKTQCVLDQAAPIANKIKKLEQVADDTFERVEEPSAKKRKRI